MVNIKPNKKSFPITPDGIVFFSWSLIIIIAFLCIAATAKAESWEEIEKNIIFQESSGNEKAKSSDGHGLYQITSSVLDDFNLFNRSGHSYRLDDLYISNRARVVYIWQIKRLRRQFKECKVKVVNSYRMGASNTILGVYNLAYLMVIVPEEIPYFFKRYEIIKHLRKRIYLIREKYIPKNN